MSKISAIFISFSQIFLFWIVIFGFALLNTFFNEKFYNQNFISLFYEQSRNFVISEFDNQTNKLTDFFISNDDFVTVLDKYYQISDVEWIKDQFLSAIKKYEITNTFVLSLQPLKDDFQNISNDLSKEVSSDFLSYYVKSILNFGQYIPPEINLGEGSNTNFIQLLSYLFNQQLLLKSFWVMLFVASLIMSCLLWSKSNKQRFKFGAVSLGCVTIVNLLLSLGFFKFIQIFFLESFPIKKINHVEINISPEIYNLFVKPLYSDVMYGILFSFAICLILYVISIFLKEK